MINELKEAFNFINNLSSSIRIKIISPRNLTDVKENIEELNTDINSLKDNILKLKSTNIEPQEKLTQLVSDLNISLVDILQDIENIHEILIEIGKNYSHYLDEKSE